MRLLDHGSRILGGCSLAAAAVVPGGICRRRIPGALLLRTDSRRRACGDVRVAVAAADESLRYRTILALDHGGSRAGPAADMAPGKSRAPCQRSPPSSLLSIAHLAVF